MKKESFEHNLIKGKIAETIFELMFRDTGKFTVLRFGYEFTVPTLAQHRDTVVMKKVLNQVEKSPDFILVTENKEQVYFVEVKYRANPSKESLLEIAQGVFKRWEISHLFIITNDGFYFSPTSKIISKKGGITKLSTNWVTRDIQNKYLSLSTDFLTRHKD